jgi:hypothetical protein
MMNPHQLPETDETLTHGEAAKWDRDRGHTALFFAACEAHYEEKDRLELLAIKACESPDETTHPPFFQPCDCCDGCWDFGLYAQVDKDWDDKCDVMHRAAREVAPMLEVMLEDISRGA